MYMYICEFVGMFTFGELMSERNMACGSGVYLLQRLARSSLIWCGRRLRGNYMWRLYMIERNRIRSKKSKTI